MLFRSWRVRQSILVRLILFVLTKKSYEKFVLFFLAVCLFIGEGVWVHAINVGRLALYNEVIAIHAVHWGSDFND